MPQFDFVLSEKERIEVIQFVLQNGCRIIPGHHYNEEKYIEVANINGYFEYCKEVPLLFFINDLYSFYQLEMDFFQAKQGKSWFIKQRQGGPTIDFFSPIVGEKNENIVGPGYIGIYEYYFHGGNRITPNAELLNFFKSFKSYIQSIAKPVKLSKRTYWIGNYTIEQTLCNKLKILPISGVDIIRLV